MGERVSGAWRIEGRVQGVGFRYFVLQHARSLGLSGWVSNLPDGSVEVQAVGDAVSMARLQAALKEGPLHAAVVRVTSVPPSKALERKDSFTIEYTLA